MDAEPIYAVVSPEGDPPTDMVTMAAPVSDLSEITIAEIWDYRFKGDQMFSVIEDELRLRYPGVQFVSYDVFGDTHSPEEEKVVESIPALLEAHGCRAAISAVGA
jgi:hypothetical protein